MAYDLILKIIYECTGTKYKIIATSVGITTVELLSVN